MRNSRFFNEYRQYEHLERRRKDDLDVFHQRESKHKANIDMSAKLYQDNDYSRAQQELVQLLKEKIDPNGQKGKEKARLFVAKLREHLANQVGSLKIDDVTVAKIEELFLTRKMVSDSELAGRQFNEEAKLEQKVGPSVEEYRDPEYIPQGSWKERPISFQDYNEYIFSQYIDINNKLDQTLDEAEYETPLSIFSDDEVTEYGVGPHRDKSEYEEAIMKKRHDLTEYLGLESVQYSLDTFSVEDLYRSRGYEGLEKDLKSFELILGSLQSESTSLEARLDEQEKVIMKHKGINHDPKEPAHQDLLDKHQQERMSKDDKSMTAALNQQLEEVEGSVVEELMPELYEQFKQTRRAMEANIVARKELIESIREIKALLRVVTDKKDSLQAKLAAEASQLTGDAAPGGFYKFSDLFQSLDNSAELGAIRSSLKTKQQLSDRSSIEMYNEDLSVLVKVATLSKGKTSKDRFKAFEMLFNLMEQNQVRPNEVTQLRIFEYAVLTQNETLANVKLRDIVLNPTNDNLNIVMPQILEQFYKQCLRTDNFTGLGHLINYAEKIDLNTASWSLMKFQSALNYYLNDAFDLSKLMTFTRYYTHVNQNRLDTLLTRDYEGRPIDQLADSEKRELHSKVFSESDKLIDMQSLFGHLVERVGQKDVVDPFTKQDVLWSLVDFFTRRGMAGLAQKGATPFSSLGERDIAKYFQNHLDSAKAFERATTVVLRFDGHGEGFQNSMIQVLREYQANQSGSLPFSFEAPRVRAAYLRLKQTATANEHSKKISEKSLEYFLELFQGLRMWPEVMDACHNFEKLTGLSGEGSELRQQYLANAILNMPKNDHSGHHYNEVIQKSVFNGQEGLLTPSYITNMTKAHLKDGAIPHAIRFFSQSIERLGEVKQKREDYLVSLFDEVFGKEASEEMTYEKFRDRYIHAIHQTEQTIKEARAFTSLKEVLQEKDYLGIQALLKYYLVKSEERTLLLQIVDGDAAAAQELENYSFSEIASLREDLNISDAQLDQLDTVKTRLGALKEQVKSTDLEKMLEIKKLMGDRQFKAVTGLKNVSPQDLADMFNVHNDREVIDMLESAYGLHGMAEDHVTSRRAMQTMADFHETVDELNKMDAQMHNDDIYYEFGTQQSKRMKEAFKEEAQVYLEDAKQDVLADEYQEMRAEEALKNPSRTKGTEEEDIRADINRADMIEWQEWQEFMRRNGLTQAMLDNMSDEQKEWIVGKIQIEKELPHADLVVLPPNFNTDLLRNDQLNDEALLMTLEHEQEKFLREKGDPGFAVQEDLESRMPSMGGKTKDELFQMLGLEYEPAEAINEMLQQRGTKVKDLFGTEGDVQRRKAAKIPAYFTPSASESTTTTTTTTTTATSEPEQADTTRVISSEQRQQDEQPKLEFSETTHGIAAEISTGVSGAESVAEIQEESELTSSSSTEQELMEELRADSAVSRRIEANKLAATNHQGLRDYTGDLKQNLERLEERKRKPYVVNEDITDFEDYYVVNPSRFIEEDSLSSHTDDDLPSLLRLSDTEQEVAEKVLHPPVFDKTEDKVEFWDSSESEISLDEGGSQEQMTPSATSSSEGSDLNSNTEAEHEELLVDRAEGWQERKRKDQEIIEALEASSESESQSKSQSESQSQSESSSESSLELGSTEVEELDVAMEHRRQLAQAGIPRDIEESASESESDSASEEGLSGTATDGIPITREEQRQAIIDEIEEVLEVEGDHSEYINELKQAYEETFQPSSSEEQDIVLTSRDFVFKKMTASSTEEFNSEESSSEQEKRLMEKTKTREIKAATEEVVDSNLAPLSELVNDLSSEEEERLREAILTDFVENVHYPKRKEDNWGGRVLSASKAARKAQLAKEFGLPQGSEDSKVNYSQLDELKAQRETADYLTSHNTEEFKAQEHKSLKARFEPYEDLSSSELENMEPFKSIRQAQDDEGSTISRFNSLEGIISDKYREHGLKNLHIDRDTELVDMTEKFDAKAFRAQFDFSQTEESGSEEGSSSASGSEVSASEASGAEVSGEEAEEQLKGNNDEAAEQVQGSGSEAEDVEGSGSYDSDDTSSEEHAADKYVVKIDEDFIMDAACNKVYNDSELSDLEVLEDEEIDISQLKAEYSSQEMRNQSNPNNINAESAQINSEIFEEGMMNDAFDPLMRQIDFHDHTLLEMQEELLEAVNTRRQDVLEITVGIFNKIQDKLLPRQKLNKLNTMSPQDGSVVDFEGAKVAINETLELCNKLINDQRSPLISALQTFGRFNKDQIDVPFTEIYEQYGTTLANEQFDIRFEILSQKHLVGMNEKLKLLQAGLHALNVRILQEQEALNRRRLVQEESRKKEERKKQFKKQVEQKTRQLYDHYQQQAKAGKGVTGELTRAAKLELLQDLFALEFQSSLNNRRTPNRTSFVKDVFPAYYAQDLLAFGLQHNIPEAVRLGEQMMSQNGYQISEQMAWAVRTYKLSNQESYRKAMKATGPIDDASLYRKVASKNLRNGVEGPTWLGDEEAYRRLMETTYKRSEAWRRPDAYAWSYKRFGVMSEFMPKHLTDDYIKKQEQFINSIF